MRATPVRALVWLLRLITSRDAASAAVGDAIEELHEREAAGAAPRHPTVWLNVQLTRALAAGVVSAAPRLARTSVLVMRDAIRALRAAPGHSLFSVAVLVVGVTVGTITYAVVDAVVLKPLPIEDADRLVYIDRRDGGGKERIDAEVYWRLRAELTSVDAVSALVASTNEAVTANGTSGAGAHVRASADAFDILHLQAGLGRLWTRSDEDDGRTDVAVLGYRFWRERFGGSPSAVGGQVSVGRFTYTVIGVLSADSDHPDVDILSRELWTPMGMPHTGPSGPFAVLARMRHGVTAVQLSSDVQRVVGASDWRPRVTRLHDSYTASAGPWLWLALGTAGLVVIVACVNAANLQLTRSAHRVQEVAVRASLGASRARLAASELFGGLTLSMFATAVSLAASLAGVEVAKRAIARLPSGMFRDETIAVNRRVLLAAMAASVVTGIIVAAAPAWKTSRASLATLLKEGATPQGAGRRRWRSTLLVAEVATVTVLLVVSWLFVASFVRVMTADVGFNPKNLVAVTPRGDFRAPVADVARQLEALPGVSGVAVSMRSSLPLVGRAYRGAWISQKVQAQGPGAAPTPTAQALDYRVTSNYFEVSGMRFIRGGPWAPEPGPVAPSAVVDERLAREAFGSADPVGKTIRHLDSRSDFTVVGVVPYVPVWGPEEDALPSVYFSQRVGPTRAFASLLVKTTRPAADMVTLIDEALEPVAPSRSGPYIHDVADALPRIVATRRFNAELLTIFGIVAVIIGAAGVYAVMASIVAQQSKDIGIRMALGATAGRIHRDVLTLTGRHVLLGLGLGMASGWWISRGFASMLFRVTPTDVSVYAGVAAVIIIAGVLAAWTPARRAARVDPIISLRS